MRCELSGHFVVHGHKRPLFTGLLANCSPSTSWTPSFITTIIPCLYFYYSSGQSNLSASFLLAYCVRKARDDDRSMVYPRPSLHLLCPHHKFSLRLTISRPGLLTRPFSVCLTRKMPYIFFPTSRPLTSSNARPVMPTSADCP